MNDLSSPAEILGTNQFPDWYPGQYDLMVESVDWYYRSSKRFLGIAVPTGAGKSVSAMLLSKFTGARTVILTATRGLQDQYAYDIKPLGGCLVKGQNNFRCLVRPEVSVEHGHCHVGLPCEPDRVSSKNTREACPYHVQLRRGLTAPLVVTNYAYWLAQTNYSIGLGDVDLLICDEAHQAFGAMEGFLTVSLSFDDIRSVGCDFPTPEPEKWNVWRTWAETQAESASASVSKDRGKLAYQQTHGEHVSVGALRRVGWQASVVARLKALADIDDQWIVQRVPSGYRFVPKWVAGHSELLFHPEDVPKVVLMSAILSPRTASYLGVTDKDDLEWIEAESHFPAANSPIWHVPTMRLDYRVKPEDMTPWVSRIDQLIGHRLDRKGLVLTVSYARAKLLLSRSRFKDIMLSHDTNNVTEIVERFKEESPPSVLVSPSVTTGYDFPMQDQAQYIIIGKIPYPDMSDAVGKARREDDKDWASYIAMETLVQSCGRMTRSATDLCEVICIDDNFKWFYPRFSSFAPGWFKARYSERLSRAGLVAQCAV